MTRIMNKYIYQHNTVKIMVLQNRVFWSILPGIWLLFTLKLHALSLEEKLSISVGF